MINMEQEIDYKAQDKQRILEYLKNAGMEVKVDSLIQESGAERLRVYPILFELMQDRLISVVSEDDLGAPVCVKLI